MKRTFHLQVDKQIVSALSKQTYVKNFAYSIRELVSNAYDADALTVKINYDKSLSYLEIEDDGNGMTEPEFVNYLRIAATKSQSESTRRYKRKRIGQFGVGFLSIFPFCDSIEITTTAENNEDVITAVIPSKKYFDFRKNEEVSEIQIDGNISKSTSEKQRHYTKIRLIKPTYLAKQQFAKIETKKRDSIVAWKPDKRFEWELQEDLPISYDPKSKFFSILRYDEPIGINVILNGKHLYRNDLSSTILEMDVRVIEGIGIKYIFTTPYTSIKPIEARGVKVRVNNVGIGGRTDFFLKRHRGFSRLHWIDGEVYFSEKIKDQLNISREDFLSSPLIDKIFQYLADALSKHAYDIEKISESETELNAALNQSKSKKVKPMREVVEGNLKVLEARGFDIVRKPLTQKKTSFNIDKEKKVVTISYEPENLKEYITVLGKKFEIEYATWNYSTPDNPSCRYKKGNSKVIEINQSYPLFKSRSQGNIFKKICILLLVASNSTNTAQEMFRNINRNFLNEFEDYT